MTKVLVAYASKHGATAGIAFAVGEALTERGLEVDVREVHTVESVTGYDAVILGGALYINHWIKPARQFAKQHERELREIPVWLFSSGPLDDSADAQDLPMVPGVAKVASRLNASAHRTFGGQLGPEDDGWAARAMVKDHGGDFRNWDVIRAWALGVADSLTDSTAPA